MKIYLIPLIIFVALIILGCTSEKKQVIELEKNKIELATFAGGCFWCMESVFQELVGVDSVISGYSGGKEENPTYKEVSSGSTGHRESIQIFYDPNIISYDQLLYVFWRQVNPTDKDGQFVDRGFQYTSAIMYHTDFQKEMAEKSKKEIEKLKVFSNEIVTPIEEYENFYPAEEYHQDYYKKSSIKYKYYRNGSGRDQFVKKTWDTNYKKILTKINGENEEKIRAYKEDFKGKKYSKPSDEEIKEMLTELQYKVTQNEGTEKPFDNEYWDNNKEGIYVDIVSGEPLFSSKDKYKSGTGWPSFTKPLVEENIVLKKDKKLFVERTEVRSKYGDSHLGHVFDDGPKPTGLRYCMNSAALRFINKNDLLKEGYEEFLYLFE